MEWQAEDGEKVWTASTDKWKARVEQETGGWFYKIEPIEGELPNAMGYSASVEIAKTQVEAMIGYMD